MQENILPENSSYEFDHSIINWKDNYRCHTNCSGLITDLLKHCYGLDLKQRFSTPNPRALHYYEAIVSERDFERIEYIQYVLPGDLIAINYKPEPLNLDCTTGHVMVARTPAIAIDPSPPLIPDTIQWELEIIDCTNTGHGTTDSRFISPGIYRKGIGKGFVRLYSLEDGKIVGYTWRRHESSKLYLEDSRPLAVGRLKNLFKNFSSDYILN